MVVPAYPEVAMLRLWMLRLWMLRLWMLRLFPFVEKWLHVGPACCGTCPTCVSAGAAGIALDLVASNSRTEDDLRS
jgi:hypothetical protein